jgi:hypothetical protein
METATVLRKELQDYIAEMPERHLFALKPLLSELAEPLYTIETDLTGEEKAIIAEGDKEFKEHPEHFVPLESLNWN